MPPPLTRHPPGMWEEVKHYISNEHFELNIPTRPPKTYESIQTSTAQQVFDQFQQIICNRVRQRTTYRNEPQRKLSLRITDLAQTESLGI